MILIQNHSSTMGGEIGSLFFWHWVFLLYHNIQYLSSLLFLSIEPDGHLMPFGVQMASLFMLQLGYMTLSLSSN